MSKKKNKKKKNQNQNLNQQITEKLSEQVKNEAEPYEEPSVNEIKAEEHERAETLRDVLYDEFEDLMEEPDDDNSEENQPEISSVQPERPKKFYLVFAVFIIIMSVVGIVSTVQFGIRTVNEIANQTSLKNDIALFLYPIVTVDPPEFSETKDIPPSVVIESAIWRIILTGDNSNYETLYNTYMYVPAVDVEFSVRTLYGNSAEIVHQTVGSASTAFTYEENKNSYLVPISPRYTAYSPVITEISNIGELYTVTVEYMPPTALAIEGIRLENSTTKTMIYTLSKSKKNMVVHSAKNATALGDVNVY